MIDPTDATILAARTARRNQIQGPRIGDFLEGQGRFSHDWGDTIQWSEGGSFYLANTGHASFSGGLNPAIPKQDLTLIGEREGLFWFFHHDQARAHNGVEVQVPCRIYRRCD